VSPGAATAKQIRKQGAKLYVLDNGDWVRYDCVQVVYCLILLPAFCSVYKHDKRMNVFIP
jgi:hypothetical protein